MNLKSKSRLFTTVVVGICYYPSIIVSFVSFISLLHSIIFEVDSIRNELFSFLAFTALAVSFCFVRARVCCLVSAEDTSCTFKRLYSSGSEEFLVSSHHELRSLIILGLRFVVFRVQGVNYLFVPKDRWLVPLCPFWISKIKHI